MSGCIRSNPNSDWTNKNANKQLPLEMVVNQNIIHGPRPDILLAWFRWWRIRHYICLASPCFEQLHVQSSEILDCRFCLFDPLIRFCSPSEHMQTICIFAKFFAIVYTVASKLSQGFVPEIAAKITVPVTSVGRGGKDFA